VKKVLILSAAIVAASLLHASATTTAPTVVQTGVVKIRAGHQCAQVESVFATQTDTAGSTVVATLVGGDIAHWVTGTAFRPSNRPLLYTNYGIQVCLNSKPVVHGNDAYFVVTRRPQP
jgi:hypothetical protein